MGILLFVFCLVSCLALTDKQNQNFRINFVGTGSVNLTTAWIQCKSAGLCGVSGCCSGHGVCVWNSTSSTASCSCDFPQECRSQFPSSPSSDRKYSGNKCQNLPSTNDCCTSGDDDLTFSHKGGCHLTGDPDFGAKGNLLKREGDANYSGTTNNEGSATPWIFNATKIDSMASEFNASTLNVNNSQGTLLGLGFLELALKDIVDFEYDLSHNVTFDGVSYPSLKWQTNTGPGYGIPKQFANTASGVIDLGPLYDWAPRASSSSPYLNLQPALDYWGQVHHMPVEFIVALKFYNQYHSYAAQSFEEYYCDGRNSLSAPLTSCGDLSLSFPSATAPLNRYANWQEFIFEQARRSTIRFSQALLEVSILQIILENTAVNGTDWGWWAGSNYVGYWDPVFEMWWRRDQQPQFNGASGGFWDYTTSTWGGSPLNTTSIRQHQEWQGDVTRANLTHHLVSGLDFLISLRPQFVNWAAGDFLSGANCDGIVPSVLARQVISLAHTPLQRFGSRIQANYTSHLKLQFHRANELGLGSYNTHLGYLTQPQPATLATDIANFFYGALKEAQQVGSVPPAVAQLNPRLYRGRTPSVAMASIVPINDALMVDRTGYWGQLPNQSWSGPQYHPEWISTYQPYSFTFEYPHCSTCYDSSGNPNFTSAGCVIVGYCGNYGDTAYSPVQSTGLTFPSPYYFGLSTSYLWANPNNEKGSGGVPDKGPTYPYQQTGRLGATNGQVLPEFLNALFYQHDGWTSIALAKVQQFDPDTNLITEYLAGQLYDSIPVNIGWTSKNYDGACYTSQYFYPTCARADTTSYLTDDACGTQFIGYGLE